MSENGGNGADAPQNIMQVAKLSAESVSGNNGKREPRTRRTRNASRGWDVDDDHQRYQQSKEDRTVSMASMILARIDGDAYEQAAWDDADCIMKNHVLPNCLPWNKPRVPLLRSLPRDIEDMQGVWHAGEGGEGGDYSNHNNSGPFGYGMHEMGGLLKEDVKGTRAETIIAKPSTNPMANNPLPLSPHKRLLSSSGIDEPSGLSEEQNEIPFQCGDKIDAAARRSEDPGIIELAVKLPLPSLKSRLLQCQRHNMLPRDPWVKHSEKSLKITKSILQAERAEKCSSMPLYWSKVDKEGVYEYTEPPAFLDLPVDEDDSENSQNSIYKMMQNRQKRKRKIEKLSNACTRKWKLSVKVANVSSRAILVDQESRPLYCAAILPSYVQSGQSLTFESAAIKDKEEGLRESLGSYDCRATAAHPSMSFEAMDDEDLSKPTKKGSGQGRSKRINVGRSRLIWTRANTLGTKTVFSSTITGQKLEMGAYKRPKDVKVIIRINGKIICDVIENEGNQKKTKGVANIFSQAISWSVIKVNKAINAICPETQIEPNLLETKNKSVEYHERAQCMLEPDEFFSALYKKIKDREKAGIQPNRVTCGEPFEGEMLPSYRIPSFCSYPLEDGYMRTYCELPGSLTGSKSLPKLLSNVAGKENEAVCTICWEGSGGVGSQEVRRCVKCKLLVHEDCCLDKGTLYSSGWTCATCTQIPRSYNEILLKLSDSEIKLENGDSNNDGSRKSRRKSRTPTRFKKEYEKKSQVKSVNGNLSSIPKCTLCPHSGGAMSMTVNEGIGANRRQRWTHEVCRIWCSGSHEIPSPLLIQEFKSSTGSPHPNTDQVCCICGMGKVHNAGEENEEVLLPKMRTRQSTEPPLGRSLEEDMDEVPGLIKCAAVGCNIRFHPMCALIHNKLLVGKVAKRSEGNEKNKHLFNCQKFSLELLDVVDRDTDVTLSDFSEAKNGNNDPCVIPVGFCSMHNFSRRESFGCMPYYDEQNKVLVDKMKIPYQDV